MAPRGEKSQLKRARGSLPEDESETKKPRRSTRLSQQPASPDKTPISHKRQLPSPITNLEEESSSLITEPVSTPPVKNKDFPPAGQSQQQQQQQQQDINSPGQSSPPPDATQPFASQAIDQQAMMQELVEDEVKEGVWGYLYPLDSRQKVQVLKRRTACSGSDTAESATAKCGGKATAGKTPLKQEEAYEQTKVKGVASGGYLIGRHGECDIIVDDQNVSNRHCLIYAENKGQDTVAVVEDLSTNGTYVNEAIIGRNQRRELKEHDEIAILKDSRWIFKYPKSRQTSEFHQQYTLLQKLGKGHFAEVYLCVEKSSGRRYAVKIFTRTPGPEDRSKTEGLHQEIAMLMGVSHPNVLCLKDTFDESSAVYLVLELAPEGELFNFIVMKQKLSESETRKMFLQIFQGVKYLHDRNIVHRDIKPENILMADSELHVKIADFGLAKIIGEESFTTTLCGTPSYVAPEILADTKHRKYTKAVDVWSLGVVLYICLCGFPPFSDELTSRQYPYTMSQQIRGGRFDYPSPYWDSVSDWALDLIDRMLVVDPDKRYSIDQCLEHTWVRSSPPGVNDSTGGLVGGIQGLDVGRRGVARERTLLASLNSVREERVPAGDRTIAVFSKNRHRVTNAPGQDRDRDRDPHKSKETHAKGDKAGLADADGSIYAKADMSAPKKRGQGRK